MRKKDCEKCKKSFSKMYRIRHIKSVKEGNKFINMGGPGKVNLPKFAI